LAGGSTTAVTNDILQLSTIGTAIVEKRNGGVLASVTDSSITTGTKAGLRNGVVGTPAIRFDDFYVEV
jgi:hypothetical protein